MKYNRGIHAVSVTTFLKKWTELGLRLDAVEKLFGIPSERVLLNHKKCAPKQTVLSQCEAAPFWVLGYGDETIGSFCCGGGWVILCWDPVAFGNGLSYFGFAFLPQCGTKIPCPSRKSGGGFAVDHIFAEFQGDPRIQ